MKVTNNTKRILGAFYADKGAHNTVQKSVTLFPGDNAVDSAEWAKIKPSFSSSISRGDLVAHGK